MPILPLVDGGTKGAVVAIAQLSLAGVSSVQFTNIPAKYQDLMLTLEFNLSSTSSSNIYFQLGTGGTLDTSTSYANAQFYYSGGTSPTLTGSSGLVSTPTIGVFSSATGTNSALITANILDYTNTSIYKTVATEGGKMSPSTAIYLGQTVTTYTNSTNAITNLLVGSSAVSFGSGTAYLYGIRTVGQ